MTNLFTYYEELPAREVDSQAERSLLNLWQVHHSRLGFRTHVMRGMWECPLAPYEYESIVNAFPSANYPGYDRACFRRWLRMSVNGGVLMDYDCFLYDPNLACYFSPNGKIRLYQREKDGVCPGIVFGAAEDYAAQCQRFMDYKVLPDDILNGKPHVSDMTILRRQAHEHPETISCMAVMKDYGDDGWHLAPAVHYKQTRMRSLGLVPRWKLIPKLRRR